MNKNLLIVALSTALLGGCATDPYTGQTSMNNLGKGGAIGAAVGAGAGALFGGNRLENAGFGALAGSAVGALVGAYMDKQQEEMQRSLQGTGIELQRTSENTLNLTMPSSITFATDSATLTPQAQSALDSVANVLNQYADSTVNITGHTDDIGSDSYNQRLSEQRASSVSAYLAQKGVNYNRLSQRGMGEKMPKVPNTNEANRAQNRRVELAIVANKGAGGNAAPQQQGGYPQQQQQGYPQQGGYPQQQQQGYPQQGGYPQQQQGYPRQGGYPQQQGYPQGGGY